jgi:D-glycero-D-manno-heptose 1,7-bisphosphate phosphatase
LSPGGRRAVFLDRDGVLNRAIVRNGRPYPPATPAELEIVPGAAEALAALRSAGFLLIGATNQPDVVRGTQRREAVEAINAALMAALPLDDLLVCYHDDGDGCRCRKPAPGLLLEAAGRYSIDLAGSFMVGDRWRDVEAGRQAGCATVFIDCGYSERAPEVGPDLTVRSLAEAAVWILGGTERVTDVGELI